MIRSNENYKANLKEIKHWRGKVSYLYMLVEDLIDEINIKDSSREDIIRVLKLKHNNEIDRMTKIHSLIEKSIIEEYENKYTLQRKGRKSKTDAEITRDNTIDNKLGEARRSATATLVAIKSINNDIIRYSGNVDIEEYAGSVRIRTNVSDLIKNCEKVVLGIDGEMARDHSFMNISKRIA